LEYKLRKLNVLKATYNRLLHKEKKKTERKRSTTQQNHVQEST